MSFGFLDCCGRREGEAMVMQRKTNLSSNGSMTEEAPKCGVGIVFAGDGNGGLAVKGFVPRSTAAKCGQILEHDLLVRVDGTDVHGWPVGEIAPLMLGPAGSTVTLGFLRRIPNGSDTLQRNEEQGDRVQGGVPKSKVPKLWKQGETPRNEAGSHDGKGDQFRLFQVSLTRQHSATFCGPRTGDATKARPPPDRFIPS